MNYVPYPWTPVEFAESEKGVLIKVWGREYYFGNEIFPISIIALEQELLSSPIKLVGSEATGEIAWKNKYLWVQKADDREVVLCGAQETDSLVISSVISISYDGYMNIRFKLCTTGTHPRAGFDVGWSDYQRRVEKLWLEIPLKKEVIKLCSYGSWNTGVKSGFVKEGFTPFAPHSWYGNDNVGLGIYFDSDENWQSINRNSAIERFSDDDTYTIRYHLLDSNPLRWEREEREVFSPADINKKAPSGLGNSPLTYEINIQATPTKEFDKGFLKEHMLHIDCFDRIEGELDEFLMAQYDEKSILLDHIKAKGTTTIVLHQSWNKIQGYWQLGPKDDKKIRRLIEEIHKRNMKVLFYFSNGISSLRPVSDEYVNLNRYLKYNGQQVVSFYRQPPQRIVRTCAKSPDTFKDLKNGMVEFLTKYNGDGVYIDSADIPWECTNAAHGCGYVDEYGVRQATYPINAMRKALQEIYEEIYVGLGKTIQFHPANAFIPALHTWCNLVWNGEQIAFKFKTNTKELFAALDDGFMRTEMIGKNIGVPVQFLAYDLPDDSWNIKKALSVTAPFGVYPRPINVNKHLDFMSEIWKILVEFEVNECSFTAFYEKTNIFADNSNLKISRYDGKNKVIVVSNPTDIHIENCKIWGAFEAETELKTGEKFGKGEIVISLEPYEVKFIKCK